MSRDLVADLEMLPTRPTVQGFVDACERYLGAIRSFAAAHADVVLIDAAREFSNRPIDERARLFVDWEHLSVEGNRLTAGIAVSALEARGVVMRNRR